jgi:hypothetical protein
MLLFFNDALIQVLISELCQNETLKQYVILLFQTGTAIQLCNLFIKWIEKGTQGIWKEVDAGDETERVLDFFNPM